MENIDKFNELELIDINSIQNIIKLANNDNSIVESILKSFIEDTTDLLKTAINAKDNYDIKYSIHSIKGLAATLGAKRLAEIAKELDIRIKNGLFEEVKQDLPKLSEAIKSTIDLLESKYLQS